MKRMFLFLFSASILSFGGLAWSSAPTRADGSRDLEVGARNALRLLQSASSQVVAMVNAQKKSGEATVAGGPGVFGKAGGNVVLPNGLELPTDGVAALTGAHKQTSDRIDGVDLGVPGGEGATPVKRRGNESHRIMVMTADGTKEVWSESKPKSMEPVLLVPEPGTSGGFSGGTLR